jgi:hypothetical protein
MLSPIKFLTEKIRDWLPKAHTKFKAQAAEIEAKVKQNNLHDLPESQKTRLKNALKNLSIPLSYQEAIKSKLTEAIAKWQKEKDAANTLLILGNPMENISKILKETLAEWKEQELYSIKLFPSSSIHSNYSTIKSQILEEIGISKDNKKSKPLEENPVLIIIPDLSKCFLRCVDGLEGIECLQDLLFKDNSRFWLIGCNDCAWEYFKIVYQLGSYFEEIIPLPTLKGVEIKEWLTPVLEMIELDFDLQENNDENIVDIDEKNWISSLEKTYFEHLAEISLGLSSVASRLFLFSLGMEKNDDKSVDSDENNNTLQSKIQPPPDLPELSKDHRYLLFSLCLHGGLELPELALSLGESYSKVRNQVQLLWHLGILEKKKGVININPAHYPRLRKNLDDNQFLMGESK